jgi:tRNA pseudouridine38-40 synthase
MERNQRKKAKMQSGLDPNTVRTVYAANLVLENEEEDWYRMDFILQGALYKQVRNMVGTAMDVVFGNLSESEFLQLLHLQPNPEKNDDDDDDDDGNLATGKSSRSQSPFDRKTRCHNPSKPAPPHGLTLEYVYFDHDDDPNF